MTEIPEHLLKRSRAAKGKGDDASPSESAAVTPAADAAAAPAAAGPAAITAAAAAIPADKPAPAAPPEPDFIVAAKKRKKIPGWALPLVAAVPIWAISYAGTMQQPEVEDPLFTAAEETYLVSGGCSGCHGGAGGGGVGYKLSDGSVVDTFPDPIDQMVHIARGSSAIQGEEYGGERSDGRRESGATGGQMPAFETTLDQVHLELVVFHERAVLSGEDTSSPGYQEWMEHMREEYEEGVSEPIDLEFLLKCANPEYTPGATGEGSDDEDHPCPGPHAESEEEVAAG